MKKKDNVAQKKEIASRVQEIRNKTGMTQEQLSEKLELSLSAYKKIESAENYISLDSLCKLEEYFGVSTDYILCGKRSDVDETWKMILNCSEMGKMKIMYHLWHYFGVEQKGTFSTKEEQMKVDEIILATLRKIDLS